MDQQTKYASAEAVAQEASKTPASAEHGPYVGRPLDGSQYHDVIEEQEYAEQRPTTEEQRPRYSYLHPEEQKTVMTATLALGPR